MERQNNYDRWGPIDWSPSIVVCQSLSKPSDIELESIKLVGLLSEHAKDFNITDTITRYWIGWETPSNIRSYVNDLLERSNNGLLTAWVACNKIHESPIGMVYFDSLDTPFFGAYHELNFWVHENQWGNGYAYLMARAALNWAYDNNLDRIMLSWTEGNIQSAKVISKLLNGNQDPQIVNAEKHDRTVKVFNHVIQFDHTTNT